MNETEQPVNPLLATLKARIPGETFRLPSQGVFYQSGELSEDVKNGEVHVFPITAIDEIILKTPDKLLSGTAVNEVFSRCIPQVRKPLQLLSKDVDYLLMCLRLISYGETVDVTYKHSCENATRRNYEVELRPLISKSKPIDPTSLGSKYSLTFKSGQVAELRPALYGSVLSMYLSNFEAQKMTEEERLLDTQMHMLNLVSDTIISVDGVTDRNFIKDWLKAVPAGWMQELGESMQDVADWGPTSEYTTVCKDCGEEITIEIPLNPISFFS